MEDDFISTNYVTRNDGYFSSYRKRFYDKFYRKHLKNFILNLFYNPIFRNIFYAIIFGIIAVLIGGFTYGLGTVTLASSFFLGMSGGFAVKHIVKSFLYHQSPAEEYDDNTLKKCYKKRCITSLIIGCVLALSAVLIGTLTFGVGLIPLGSFAAMILVSAFATSVLPFFFYAGVNAMSILALNRLKKNKDDKWANDFFGQRNTFAQSYNYKMNTEQVCTFRSEDFANPFVNPFANTSFSTNDSGKPPNLEGEQQGNNEQIFLTTNNPI